MLRKRVVCPQCDSLMVRADRDARVSRYKCKTCCKVFERKFDRLLSPHFVELNTLPEPTATDLRKKLENKREMLEGLLARERVIGHRITSVLREISLLKKQLQS